jgi:hypothetical protein
LEKIKMCKIQNNNHSYSKIFFKFIYQEKTNQTALNMSVLNWRKVRVQRVIVTGWHSRTALLLEFRPCYLQRVIDICNGLWWCHRVQPMREAASMHYEQLSPPHAKFRFFSLTSVDCWYCCSRGLIPSAMHSYCKSIRYAYKGFHCVPLVAWGNLMLATIRSRILYLLSKNLKIRIDRQDDNFACGSVWVWNVVSDFKGGT